MFSLSRHWYNLRFYWQTCNRLPYYLGAGVLFCLTSLLLMVNSAVKSSQEQQQIQCLALNVYHEARGEPVDGQYAVAQVTLNRVASKRYPDNICEVVYQRNWDWLRKRYVSAFSWTELENPPPDNLPAWRNARLIAQKMFYGEKTFTQVQNALFYHARYIRPSWARKKKAIVKIGRHIFY